MFWNQQKNVSYVKDPERTVFVSRQPRDCTCVNIDEITRYPERFTTMNYTNQTPEVMKIINIYQFVQRQRT